MGMGSTMHTTPGREPDTLHHVVGRTLLAIGICVVLGVVGGLLYGLATDDVGWALGRGVFLGATAGAIAGGRTAVLGRGWRLLP